MLSDSALRTVRSASEAAQNLKGPAAVAAIGRTCATQLRAVAPLVLLSMTRVLPHAVEQPCALCDAGTAADRQELPVRLAFTEWEAGRWFVTHDELGMLGEIELAATCYRVSHASDAKGAAFGFESLALAVSYFEEYAAALTLAQ